MSDNMSDNMRELDKPGGGAPIFPPEITLFDRQKTYRKCA